MVLMRIALIGVVVVAVLGVAKHEQWFERAGVTGRCALIATPTGQTGQWWTCRQGILTGFPNMPADRCQTDGYAGERQVWRCANPVTSAPGY